MDHRPVRLVTCMLAASLSSAALAQPPSETPRMKAVVHHRFGSPAVLELALIDKPVPTDDQILVKVRAASVNPFDWHFMEGTPYLARPLAFGLMKPKETRLGVDYSGTVEAVGKNVTAFQPGDEVFGGVTGALAEYVCVGTDRAVVKKPADVSFEAAAAVPIAALTALQSLRDHGQLRAGESVLINGASGGVGTFAVQLARWLGADVTGVCSTRNVELVLSLGADRVVDYTKDDVTRGERRYDLVVDNVGNLSVWDCLRILKPTGRAVVVGGGSASDDPWLGAISGVFRTLAFAPFIRREVSFMMAEFNVADLTTLGELLQSGQVKSVIDRRYRLSEIQQALAYLELGRARGKVIVLMDETLPSEQHPPLPASPDERASPLAVAVTLFGVPLAFTVGPIVAALVLARRFRKSHPEKRPYRWGYWFSIMSATFGLLLGLLVGGTVAPILGFAIYAVLAWHFARRKRWAWIALTLLSFNPLAWLVNFFYLRKRWAEEPAASKS